MEPTGGLKRKVSGRFAREALGAYFQEAAMGEIRVKVCLENEADRFQHAQGRLARKRIRTAMVDAIVDTGAVETLLPQELVEKLGLRIFGKTTVILADDRRIEFQRAGPLPLTIGDRDMMTHCLVGPLGSQALVGQIVMESLDLIPDPRLRTLTPRPESPFRPTLGMRSERRALELSVVGQPARSFPRKSDIQLRRGLGLPPPPS